MATTTFVDGDTIIVASWLNEVDALVHDIFNGLSTTTKGDVLASNGTNIIPLAVGSNNQVLTADSSEATGVKWAAAGGDVVDDTTPQLGGALDPNGKSIGMDKGSDMASGSPTIPTDGDYFDVTGTTTISAFVVDANRHFFLQFDGALQLTHNSTDLDLPGEANITTAAGDVAEFFSTGSNDVQCVNYTRANGTSVVSAGDVVDDTSPQLGGALDCQGNDITAAGTIKMTEQADAESDTAGAGQIWVDTATPNRFMFTDDAGTDFGVSPTFISSEQTVAVDTALNVAHGLGAKPHKFTVSAICKTGDQNYAVGDEIQMWAAMHDAGDAGINAYCDGSNVGIRTGSVIKIINKTGFDAGDMDVNDWRWIVRAWL